MITDLMLLHLTLSALCIIVAAGDAVLGKLVAAASRRADPSSPTPGDT